MSELKADHIEGRGNDCPGCAPHRLHAAIAASWDAATSADLAWTHDNPSLGQCAVTALVVQDAYGGDLMRTTVDGISHYYNKLPNGVELDLTRQQFAKWAPTPPIVRDRAYVLSIAATARRYEVLLRRVIFRLAGDTRKTP